jgi:hypothetical protein
MVFEGGAVSWRGGLPRPKRVRVGLVLAAVAAGVMALATAAGTKASAQTTIPTTPTTPTTAYRAPGAGTPGFSPTSVTPAFGSPAITSAPTAGVTTPTLASTTTPTFASGLSSTATTTPPLSSGLGSSSTVPARTGAASVQWFAAGLAVLVLGTQVSLFARPRGFHALGRRPDRGQIYIRNWRSLGWAPPRRVG